jgi:hypothetical protein
LQTAIESLQDTAYNLDPTYYSNIFSNNWDYIWQRAKDNGGLLQFTTLYNIDQETCYTINIRGYRLLISDLASYLATKVSDPNYNDYYAPLGQMFDQNFMYALGSYIYSVTSLRPQYLRGAYGMIVLYINVYS